MRHILTIEPNQGYAPDQVQTITVADLRDLLDSLDADDEVCTYDYQNTYGAKYGGIRFEMETEKEHNVTL